MTNPTAKTNAQKQADLRKRRADQGITELRGVYAPTVDHKRLKAELKRLIDEAKGKK